MTAKDEADCAKSKILSGKSKGGVSFMGRIHFPVSPLAVTVISAASLIHLHPLLRSFSKSIPYAHIGDVNLTLAILCANINHILAGQVSHLYHLPFLFPHSFALTMGFTMFGHTLLVLPLAVLGIDNIAIMYNLLVFFAYIMSGLGAYLLLREMTGRHMISLGVACLYMLLPFRVGNVPHLNLLFNFPIPFCFLYLYRYLKSGRWRDLFALNGFLFFQFLFDLSLGFYLAVTLAFFYLISLIVLPVCLKKTVLLTASMFVTLGGLILIHLPFFQKDLSLSSATGKFDPAQYLPAVSFYSGKSYFLNLFHHHWNPLAFSLGITASLFFLAALADHAKKSKEFCLLAIATCASILPILLLVSFPNAVRTNLIRSAIEALLILFVFALILALMSLKRKLPAALFISTATYGVVVFISFYPFPRIFDFFGHLTRILPFLSRSRGAIRTHYIFSLLALIVIAFGIKAFLARRKKPLLAFIILALCLAIEFTRWPVQTSRPSDPGPHGRVMYKIIREYPGQSGVLELPFLPMAGNTYPQFTRFHDKHTYHGRYYFFWDSLGLENNPELSEKEAFPGLKTQDFIQFLLRQRLRLILINRTYIPSPERWMAIRKTVRAGEAAGLYEKIVRNNQAILIILRDRLVGSRIDIDIPYYFFVGQKKLSFTLNHGGAMPVNAEFNGAFVPVPNSGVATSFTVKIPIDSLDVRSQKNRLTVVGGTRLSIENLHFE